MTRESTSAHPDDFARLSSDFVNLARLSLAGRQQDVQIYLQRLTRRWRRSDPELAEQIQGLVRQAPTRSSPLRDIMAGLVQPPPVDVDTRLDLVRHELVQDLPADPIWQPEIQHLLDQLIAERGAWDRLSDVGLTPTRTALLVGPPGVGKTLAARYIAHRLELPLLVLDLAAVMSSLLGRTGTNVRHVMEYAKSRACVLLLDEFDAVAKRRDDVSEIGELKRLVTVLLQAVDDWPATGLLLAATNHPDLLDPAVWRRFEMLVDFPMPSGVQLRDSIRQFLGESCQASEAIEAVLVDTFGGLSYADIERELIGVRRRAALSDRSLQSELIAYTVQRAARLPVSTRAALAADLVERGLLSQRQAHETLHVSRDTIRDKQRGVRDRGQGEIDNG
jgi:SpoVK/Ycf46/Vps4 family AAA+-type ATPase